jgi:hypothetical protein
MILGELIKYGYQEGPRRFKGIDRTGRYYSVFQARLWIHHCHFDRFIGRMEIARVGQLYEILRVLHDWAVHSQRQWASIRTKM